MQVAGLSTATTDRALRHLRCYSCYRLLQFRFFPTFELEAEADGALLQSSQAYQLSAEQKKQTRNMHGCVAEGAFRRFFRGIHSVHLDNAQKLSSSFFDHGLVRWRP